MKGETISTWGWGIDLIANTSLQSISSDKHRKFHEANTGSCCKTLTFERLSCDFGASMAAGHDATYQNASFVLLDVLLLFLSEFLLDFRAISKRLMCQNVARQNVGTKTISSLNSTAVKKFFENSMFWTLFNGKMLLSYFYLLWINVLINSYDTLSNGSTRISKIDFELNDQVIQTFKEAFLEKLPPLSRYQDISPAMVASTMYSLQIYPRSSTDLSITSLSSLETFLRIGSRRIKVSSPQVPGSSYRIYDRLLK